jgi:outer membrane protein, heavy metal efflux system
MTRQLIVLMTMLVVFAVATANAQAPVANGGITLEEAIAMALKQEPALRGVRTQIDAASGRVQQAALRANPTVNGERRWEPGGTDDQVSIGVQWPLELFRRGARIVTAERDLAVAQHDVADRERRTAADVRVRYGAALTAIRELAVLDDLITAVQRQWDLTAARVKEGATPPLEQDLLDVEVRRLAAERRLQTGRVESALLDVRRIIGLRPDAPIVLRETLESIVARESAVDRVPATAPATVVQARPDVRAAEARVNAAAARIDQTTRDARFDVTVFGTYMRMDAGFPQLGLGPGGAVTRVRGTFNYFAGGAMVVVPVLNRNQGARAAARAEREGAVAARDAAVLDAEIEIAAARVQDRSARDAVAQFVDGAQRLARRNLDVVGQTYQLGRATAFDVLAEQRRYLEIERAFTSALREAFDARTRLQLALGDVR